MGGEYRSLASFFQSLGIHFQHSCPHIHSHNGNAERKHSQIVDTGLTLLAQSSLPLKFWWDSFEVVVFLINRLPSTALSNHTPFYCLHKSHLDYSLLRVFGCTCYSYLRPYNNHKFQFRSTKCIFLGYSLTHKRYKYLRSGGRVFIVHTVTFDGNEFPYHELFPSLASSSSKVAHITFSIPPTLDIEHSCASTYSSSDPHT